MNTDLPERTNSITIATDDAAFVNISETIERLDLVLSITRNGQVSTARLNKAQFGALCDARYELKCYNNEEEKNK